MSEYSRSGFLQLRTISAVFELRLFKTDPLYINQLFLKNIDNSFSKIDLKLRYF